jgi:hypothetical protein
MIDQGVDGSGSDVRSAVAADAILPRGCIVVIEVDKGWKLPLATSIKPVNNYSDRIESASGTSHWSLPVPKVRRVIARLVNSS